MGLLDFARPKGWLCGHATIQGIPPNFGIVVYLLIHHASRSDEAAPSNVKAYEQICIKDREDPEAWPLQFAVKQPRGIYHVGLSSIVFQNREGKLYAQVERFFPIRKPRLTGAREAEPIRITVQWPKTPVEQLGTYGTIYPRGSKPSK